MSLKLDDLKIETYEDSGVVVRVKAVHKPSNTTIIAESRTEALRMLDERVNNTYSINQCQIIAI